MENIALPKRYQFRTRSGRTVSLRRVTQADVAGLVTFLYTLSDHTRWLRYLSGRPLTPAWVQEEANRIVCGHTWPRVTLLVTSEEADGETILALAEMACQGNEPASAEVSFVVRDDCQGDGIGRMLADWLVAIAQMAGVTTLHIDTLAENAIMQRLARRMGEVQTVRTNYGGREIVVHVPNLAEAGRDSGETSYRLALPICTVTGHAD